MALAPRGLSRLAAVLCVVAIVTAPLTFPKLATVPAINSDLMAVKNSAWHRAQIWHFVGGRIAERPLLGWGMNTARVIPGGKAEVAPGMEALPLHPHNDALQLWLELGVVGALALAAILGKLWLLVPDPALPPILIAGRAMALAAGLFSLIVDYGVWQEWWLAALFISTGFVMLDRSAAARR